MRRTDVPEVYAVVDRWIAAALRGDDSLFSPGVRIWSAASVDELHSHFNLAPDQGSDSFDTKFKRQLHGSSAATYQLAAEMAYFLNLIIQDTSGAAKRRLIEKILGWAPQPVGIPPDLAGVLDRGLVGGGLAFKTLRPYQLSFLVEFMKKWKAMPGDEREIALADPWAFRSVLYDTPIAGGYAMRDTLLHLVFPDTFEDIISREHKKTIGAAFADLAGDTSADIDHQLLSIRQSLMQGRPTWFSFYDADLIGRWRPTPEDRERWDQFVEWGKRSLESIDYDAEERDYKIAIAGRLREARDALAADDPTWKDKLAVAFREDDNLVYHVSVSRFFDWVEKAEPQARTVLTSVWGAGDEDYVDRLEALSAVAREEEFNFINVASVLMMANDEFRFPPMQATPLQKAFELTGVGWWANLVDTRRYHRNLTFFERVIEEAAKRGLSLRDRLEAQSVTWVLMQMSPPDVWDEPTKRAFLEWRGDLESGADGTGSGTGKEGDTAGTSGTERGETIHSDLSSLAESLYLPEEFLRETIDLLERRGQIVFYGPPGTGKTYMARALARYLAEGRFEIVQFHPSYSYEDFVWGYRPVMVSGSMSYELMPGPLKRIAERARQADGLHVLIIDEINRGNLPKILGELLYLLEYRKDEVRLMYSRPDDPPFTLPENLLFIGTMNTADRSVGLIDAALRRRFHFVSLFPGQDPLADTLRSWLADKRPEMVYVADIVDALNAKLVPRLGPHLQLGHSHFFRVDLDADVLDRIWRYDVMPFIQDQLFGHEDELAEFSLVRLVEEVGANHPAERMDAEDRTPDG